MSKLLEAQRLLDAAQKLRRHKFDLKDFCFDKQLAFIEDPAPFKTAVCSRRAGKTVASAAHLMHAAITKERVVCLYITLSRSNGKKIIWPELLEINRRFSLGGKANESELSITFPNRSVIYVSGAKDKTEIEKFRGLALYLCYVDEAQSFRSHIENLVDEVISKALFDYNGTLCLTGTPGPTPSGYFYNCANSQEWSHHGWTMFENPWLEKKSGHAAQALVDRDLKRKGVTVNDPTIQRECYGRWVVDTNALVFKYDPSKNHFNPDDWSALSRGNSRYIMGVDLGFDDADAVAILGYSPHLPGVYLVDEIVKPKQGITELVRQIHELNHRYKPDKIVMDTGGLGKKIAEEITTRYAIMIEPAEKVRKFEFIELLNDALRTGKFFASKFSRFAQDAAILEWEIDPEKATEKPKIRDSFHSDICFPSGTKIMTARGSIAIEELNLSDQILTRDGFKPIEALGKTSESTPIVQLKFSNGTELSCTPSHPFITGRGAIAADALTYADSFITLDACERQSSLTGPSFIDTRKQSNRRTDVTIAATGGGKELTYTELFTSWPRVQSRMECTSITSMGIGMTTALKILNSYQGQSTLNFTGRKIGKAGRGRREKILKRLLRLPRGGMRQLRAMLGIRSTPKTPLRKEQNKGQGAGFVSAHIGRTASLPNRKMPFFTVPVPVEPRPEETQGWTMKNEFANSAKRDSNVQGLVKLDSAVGLVRLPTPIGNASVYNLTVKDKHEYFANGILVSNCDSVLYAFRESFHWLYEEPEPQIIPDTERWFKKQQEEMEEAAQNALHKPDEDVWSKSLESVYD